MTTIMTTWRSVLVNFVIAVSFKYGFGEEKCVAEKFKANCSRGEFVSIEGALLGRFSNSTCYDKTEDASNCFSDLKTVLQDRFGANDSISFSMADEFIYRALPSCHPSSLPFSLNISHRCAKVFDVECDVKSDEGNRPGTIEGSDLEIRCNVRFPNGISPPVMQWFRNGVKISPAIMETYHLFGSTRLKTGLLKVLLRANATDDGSLFSCRVAFNSSKAEEFVYYWNFTAIVWHGPNSIWIDPVKSVYDHDDRIRCHADGNPDPVFTWRSLSASGDEDLTNGSVLTLGGTALSGSALALECTATNRFSGFSVTKTMNVTVRSHSGLTLSYRYLIVLASCGFVVLVFLITVLSAGLMRCRESRSSDDLYVVQAINSNKENKRQGLEHVNVIYSNDSSEEEEGGGEGGGEEEVIYAEADDTCFASRPTTYSKRRLPGDGCAGHEATVTAEENDYLSVDGDNDYYNNNNDNNNDGDNDYYNNNSNDNDNDYSNNSARSLPLHKDDTKDEQEYLNLSGVNEYCPLPPTVTTFRGPVLAAATEYVSVDHTA